jgi:hypothetical protein
LESIREEGYFTDGCVSDAELKVACDIVHRRKVRLVGVLALLGPEHEFELGFVFLAGTRAHYDAAITDLTEGRPRWAHDRTEEGAGKLSLRYAQLVGMTCDIATKIPKPPFDLFTVDRCSGALFTNECLHLIGKAAADQL